MWLKQGSAVGRFAYDKLMTKKVDTSTTRPMTGGGAGGAVTSSGLALAARKAVKDAPVFVWGVEVPTVPRFVRDGLVPALRGPSTFVRVPIVPLRSLTSRLYARK